MEPNISEHISFREGTISATGTRLGIKNVPNEFQLIHMKELAQNVFEPLRAHFGTPIKLCSFFRSAELNVAVGGATNSQHMANNGSAMDIDNESNPNNKEIFDYIRNNMEFDQIISEFPDDNDYPSWVHVSYNKGKNRKNILVSNKVNGNTTYSNYI